jgi:hypothetical protein
MEIKILKTLDENEVEEIKVLKTIDVDNNVEKEGLLFFKFFFFYKIL